MNPPHRKLSFASVFAGTSGAVLALCLAAGSAAPGWFETRLDYIYFSWGLACTAIAAISLSLSAASPEEKHWRALAWFGFLFGMEKWLEVLKMNLGDSPAFSDARILITWAAFTALLEFGRAGEGRFGRCIRPAVLHTAALLGILAGAAGGTEAANQAIRYFIALPAAVWTARILYLHSHRKCSEPLRCASVSMLVLGILNGAAPGTLPSSTPFVFNVPAFPALLGLPDELIPTLAACGVSLSLWFYHLNPSNRPEEPWASKRLCRMVVPVLLFILAIGWIFADILGEAADKEKREDLLRAISAAAISLPAERVFAIEPGSACTIDANYLSLREQLGGLTTTDKRAKWFYIVTKRAGQLVILLDSTPETSPDFAPPGTIYAEAPPELRSAIEQGKALTVGPYRDKWGTFVSAWAPLRLRGPDGAVYMLGADIDASSWLQMIARHRLPSILISLLIAAALVGGLLAANRETEMHREILEGERRFRAVLDNVSLAALMIDEKCSIIYANRFLLDLLGKTDAQVLGKDWFGHFVEAGTAEDERSLFLDAFASGRATEHSESTVIGCRGVRRIAWSSTLLTRPDGAGAVVTSLGEDITYRALIAQELHKRQSRLSRQRQALMELGLDHEIRSGSLEHAARRITMTGAQVLEVERASVWFLAPDRTKMVCAALYEASAGRHSSGHELPVDVYERYFAALSAERVICTADVHRDWRTSQFAAAYFAPLNICSLIDVAISLEGNVVGVVSFEHTGAAREWTDDEQTFASSSASFMAICREAAESRRLREERRLLHDRLGHVQKLESLKVLAGGVAHDFNNLLTVILGHAQVLFEDLRPRPAEQEAVGEIVKAAERASELASQMLVYSGRGAMAMRTGALNPLIRDMVPLLRSIIGKRAVLFCSLSDADPLIKADMPQIQQVLLNLVANASEALEDGGAGRIAVSTGLRWCSKDFLARTYIDDGLPEGRYAYIQVSDNGQGIPPEHKRHLFDPFFSTKFQGRGLGLAAVLGIVRGHKGAIAVESDPGNGSSFTIYLSSRSPAGKQHPEASCGEATLPVRQC